MRKFVCIAIALFFAAAACIRVGVRTDAADEPVTPAAYLRGLLAAQAAADELLPGEALLPLPSTDWVLRLRPVSSSGATVSDRLLRDTEGIALRQGAYVNGIYLGCVTDGESLKLALRQQLYENRPPGAVHARYAGQIELRAVYTREDCCMPQEDLRMLITGLVPAVYTDGEGRLVAG